MNPLKQYSIPFTGLNIGQHQFDFEVDGRFFENFEYALVKNGLRNVSLNLGKQETMMVLDFHIKGEVQLSCDKCLADFPDQIDTQDRLIAKFSESEDLADSEEVVIIAKKESEIDVSSFIYEMINLAIPNITVCADPGNTPACDQEMLNKIDELITKEETIDDPRWDILKKIRKN